MYKHNAPEILGGDCHKGNCILSQRSKSHGNEEGGGGLG